MSWNKPPGSPALPSLRQQRLAAKKRAKETLNEWPLDLGGAKLTQAVADAAADLKVRGHSYDQFCIAAAELVVAECTRFPPNSPQAMEFFKRPTHGQLMPWTYSSRLFSVADALFKLRHCEGFEVFCKKARDHDLQSTFCEIYAAAMFADADFAIKAVTAIGKRKSDFDFVARKDADRISVEVTGFTNERYNSDTVKHALRHKRKQVPDEYPAVVFAVVPDSWQALSNEDIHAHLLDDANFFFGGGEDYPGTQAINVVVYLMQKYTDLGGKGRLEFEFTPVFNPNPRHPCPALERFMDGTLDRRPDRTRQMTSAETELMLSSLRNGSAFFQWAKAFWSGAEGRCVRRQQPSDRLRSFTNGGILDHRRP